MAKTGSKKLSHYNASGRATMVDVSAKTPTRREAEASAFVEMSAEVLRALPGEFAHLTRHLPALQSAPGAPRSVILPASQMKACSGPNAAMVLLPTTWPRSLIALAAPQGPREGCSKLRRCRSTPF